MISTDMIFLELDRLEKFCDSYKEELHFLSTKIRCDIWKAGNESALAEILKALTDSLEKEYPDKNACCIDMVVDYVYSLEQYGIFINSDLSKEYFEKLIDSILLINARIVISEQWKNINSSDNSHQSFLETFGEVFTQCIELRKSEFFYSIKKSDVLCRAVKDWGHNPDRFIPWPNKAQNRWNPPGRTYLYLSFAEKWQKFDAGISVSEYVCLEEIRAKRGEKYSFCLFEIAAKGQILDLSYNDIDLWAIRRELDNYKYDLERVIFMDLICKTKKLKKYTKSTQKLRKAIRSKSEELVDHQVIADSVAKQYLKMICSSIYKKVDEKDDVGKATAYRSFHILSEYLESMGVTGIIYPCTRTNKIVGKNLVLFNIHDAIPIKESIREIIY